MEIIVYITGDTFCQRGYKSGIKNKSLLHK